MAGTEEAVPSSPFGLLLAEVVRMRQSNLNAAIEDVDSIIDLLVAAREQVASNDDAHKIAMAMTTLQNPVKARLEAITNDLKEGSKAQRGFGKALDRALPHRELPMEADAMANHPELINRAIAMHLLREGQFSVASTFLREQHEHREQTNHLSAAAGPKTARLDDDGDDAMSRYDDEDQDEQEDEQEDQDQDQDEDQDMQGLHSEDLQDKFSEMYRILAKLKARNLVPAIEWARANNPKLEAKGSNLEFELSKLQFVWLFKGPLVNGLPDDANNGQSGALSYARQHFGRFQSRHIKEIQQLCCAMVYASNLGESPYRRIFEIDSAFDDVSTSFTREFCSLLGLSAESPLYMAVTAGSIALPRLIKYTTYMKEKKTEWTTENELAFETPLPPSMIYHPIFVCPVSKEQTTEQNPPMMLPCGHVICKESLHNIAAKGARYKCPYCPTEGHLRDAVKITL
ncbi:uncharacterized protein UV8b_04187 [Ustilaginoidea virens]|uniref:GID complex catalytic subunit 2 n=1 Tax=Ustilaginoidea virens TaxID=1159556 RepID=A0A8E5HQY1_USTVR|nr:uncharacterized protein UV8b_04187 [Ustilaginoidea virens]QUC19946.1 hypothetical protein UV8b_04187 [Ustilaginoidea virens]